MNSGNIDALGAVRPPTPAEQTAVRAFVAGQPDAAELLAYLGAGEWDV